MRSRKEKRDPGNSLVKLIGFLFLFFGISIFLKIYFPVAKAEIIYQTSKSNSQNTEITPIDPDFSIVIPKINVNTRVIKNVDPYNSYEYQKALTQGVAHAKGSSLPGFTGNTFIFAHSATDWYEASQYNAVFYLTDKLTPGDQITIYYKGSKYPYQVTEKKIVSPKDIYYLTDFTDKKTLTLMTCWPPGTTLKRLVVLASSL